MLNWRAPPHRAHGTSDAPPKRKNKTSTKGKSIPFIHETCISTYIRDDEQPTDNQVGFETQWHNKRSFMRSGMRVSVPKACAAREKAKGFHDIFTLCRKRKNIEQEL
ncbi:hypothetical protein LIER_26983 [Lithospermum erythrorhizon]|uniref:Uncharacterized protein n=1 Tax=Lithospermum erythrorhizon TaxID=34254 RepID=A0AAV3RAL6_LITER